MDTEKYRRKFVGRPEGAALRLVSGPVRPECAGRVARVRLEAALAPMRVRPEVAHRPEGLVMVGSAITERHRSLAPVEAVSVGEAEAGTAAAAVAQILGAWNLAHGF